MAYVEIRATHHFHLFQLECVELFLNSLRKRWRESIACGRLATPVVDGSRPRRVDRQVLRERYVSFLVQACHSSSLHLWRRSIVQEWFGRVERRMIERHVLMGTTGGDRALFWMRDLE